jgi:hypothetical protein
MYDSENPICIVQRGDGSFAYAGDDDVLELGDSLPRAVNRLDETGVVATHWLPKEGGMSVIPSAIVRTHLDEGVKSSLPRW